MTSGSYNITSKYKFQGLKFEWAQLQQLPPLFSSNDPPNIIYQQTQDERVICAYRSLKHNNFPLVYKQLSNGQFGGEIDQLGSGKGFYISQEIQEHSQVDVKNFVIQAGYKSSLGQNLQQNCNILYQQYLEKEIDHSFVFLNKKSTFQLKSAEDYTKLFNQYREYDLILLIGIKDKPDVNNLVIRFNRNKKGSKQQSTYLYIDHKTQFLGREYLKQINGMLPSNTFRSHLTGMNKSGIAILFVLRILFDCYKQAKHKVILENLVVDCHLAAQSKLPIDRLLKCPNSFLSVEEFQPSKRFIKLYSKI